MKLFYIERQYIVLSILYIPGICMYIQAIAYDVFYNLEKTKKKRKTRLSDKKFMFYILSVM